MDKYARMIDYDRDFRNLFVGYFEEYLCFEELHVPAVNFVYGNNDYITVSGVVRQLYYRHMKESWEGNAHENEAVLYSWVDVPHPFNLMEFCWRLILGFYSGNLEAKDTVAARLIRGGDPILQCCKILSEQNCIVVIDGLQSPQDWDLIKDTFLSEPTFFRKRSEPAMRCSVVIPTTESVPAGKRQTAEHEYEVSNHITYLEADTIRIPPIKVCIC
jgi:hypothetical protein